LVAFKGHLWAIEAIEKLRREFPDVKLVVAGSGNFEETLRAKTTELGLEEHVEFLGYRKDVGRWMKYSDIVLVTSRAEGFGVVFLEAFNARVPVVAFDVPASNELIKHDVNGFLAKPYAVDDLAARVSTLLRKPALGKAFAEQSYTRLKKEFSLQRMVTETIEWYKAVLTK
jgi:glycosyltransferase involved in cell wall biosynthesis